MWCVGASAASAALERTFQHAVVFRAEGVSSEPVIARYRSGGRRPSGAAQLPVHDRLSEDMLATVAPYEISKKNCSRSSTEPRSSTH